MRTKGALAILTAALTASLCLSGPAMSQSDELAMLQGLDKGEWSLRDRNGRTATKICVRSGLELIQIRHKQAGCNRFVVNDENDTVIVQYTCKGNGYGRTSIRQETSSLVQIEGHGILEGKPFEFVVEARRTGSCK